MTKRQYMLNSLSRKRIRASWNKYNLYNMATWRKTQRKGTLYQQKFSAKQESRSYHGEHLTETQFRNIFRGELNGVNPLQSSKERSRGTSSSADEIPWALQTYVALERRLDTAVFRSMFASSVRQAAQFIKRGAVKVNGVKIKQAGFTLKAGDVFSVEPDYVLTALGRKKPSVQESVELVNRQIRRYNKYLAKCKKFPETMWKLRQRHRRRHPTFAARVQAKQAAKNRAFNSKIQKEMNQEIDKITPAGVLENILKNSAYFEQHGTLPFKVGLGKSLTVLSMVGGGKVSKAVEQDAGEANKEPTETAKVEDQPSAEPEKVESKEAKPQQVDSLIKTTLEKYFSKTPDTPGPGNKSDVKKLLSDITKEQQEDIRAQYTEKMKKDSTQEEYDPTWVDRLPEPAPLVDLEAAKEDINAVLPVKLPFSNGKLYGLADPSKGYFTPWTPRQFLAPFAILPHHLEISFKTCHTVYLRDPVARPGQSELISPFPLDMHERAHMWYDTRKRKF